jgi:hypothetical protein
MVWDLDLSWNPCLASSSSSKQNRGLGFQGLGSRSYLESMLGQQLQLKGVRPARLWADSDEYAATFRDLYVAKAGEGGKPLLLRMRYNSDGVWAHVVELVLEKDFEAPCDVNPRQGCRPCSVGV